MGTFNSKINAGDEDTKIDSTKRRRGELKTKEYREKEILQERKQPLILKTFNHSLEDP